MHVGSVWSQSSERNGALKACISQKEMKILCVEGMHLSERYEGMVH